MAETLENEKAQPNVEVWQHKKHKIFFGLIILVLLVIAFMVGVGAGRFSNRIHTQRFVGMSRFNGYSNGYSFQSSGPIFNNSIGTNQLEITGVVTAVNGDKITVIGGGTSNQVTINSSTQYINGTSVAVNDTVDIIGQYNNNTLTATTVTIN